MNEGWGTYDTPSSNKSQIFSDEIGSIVVSEDLVAILLAITSQQDAITGIVEFWKEAISGGLTSSVNTAFKQISSLVETSKAYIRDYSIDELRKMYHGSLSEPDHDFIAMARLVLLTGGDKSAILMRDGAFIQMPSSIAQTVFKTVQDPSYLKDWGVASLNNTLRNSINRLNVVSTGIHFNELTPQSISILAKGVGAWFLTGSKYSEEFFVENVESFKPLKSVLSALPMVVDSSISYDLVLSDFMKVEYPGVLPVVFVESDPQDVYPIVADLNAPSLSVLVSDDPESPYYFERSPTIHVSSDRWDWPDIMESAQDEATALIKSQGKKGNVSHDIQVIKRRLLVDRAQERIRDDRLLTLQADAGRLPKSFAPFDKYLKCHKLGFSKLAEVAEYPNRIHFCQYTTLSEIESMRKGHKFFFVDPVNLACLIVPLKIWQLSVTASNSKGKPISPVITPTHISVPSNTLPMKGVMVIMTAYTATLSQVLIASWTDDDFPLQESYASVRDGFMVNIVTKPSKKMKTLLPKVATIPRILTALEAMVHYRFGSLYLSGGSSKIGKAKMKESAMYSQFDDFFENPAFDIYDEDGWDDTDVRFDERAPVTDDQNRTGDPLSASSEIKLEAFDPNMM